MKVPRTYTLPATLAASSKTVNRSNAIRLSINSAYDDPKVLVRMLERRLEQKKSVEDMTKVTVMIEMTDLEKMQELAGLSGLQVEHVLRLALEAHMLNS